jgi:TonB family protein
VVALLYALVLATAASDEAKATNKPHLLNGSQIMTADDYPLESLRNDEQGTVKVKLGVDRSGAVTSCTVVKSSGHAALDQKTCALFQARAKFEPALDGSGNAVDSEVTQGVGWKLSDNVTVMPRSEWMMRMIVGLTSTGAIIDCNVESAGLAMPPGKCSVPDKGSAATGTAASGHAINETYFYPVDPASAPIAPEFAGAVLASRQVSRVTISPDGQVIACEPAGFSGTDTSHRDRCDALSNFHFQNSPGLSGPTVGTLVSSDYVNGTAAN